MFIRAADKKDVPLPRTMVSDVNIRREVRACQMTEVKQPGQVAGSSAVWVLGTVPMGNRAYFRASVGEAPAYRVRVLSFDWTGRGGV